MVFNNVQVDQTFFYFLHFFIIYLFIFNIVQVDQTNRTNNNSLMNDLDSIRMVFNEKEKELAMAVTKVDQLTTQLEELKSGKLNYNYPPQVS